MPNIKQDEESGRKMAKDKNAEYAAKKARRNTTATSSLNIHQHIAVAESIHKGDDDRAQPFGLPGALSILRKHSSSKPTTVEADLQSPCSSVRVELSRANSGVSSSDAYERRQSVSSLITIDCSDTMGVAAGANAHTLDGNCFRSIVKRRVCYLSLAWCQMRCFE